MSEDCIDCALAIAKHTEESKAELERARDTAVALEGRVAELEAALAEKHTWTERDAANLARIRLEDDLRHAKRGLAAKQQVIEDAALAWERENAARENAEVSLRRAEGEKATMRAALEKIAHSKETDLGDYAEMVLDAAQTALAGTGDEVGAVVRAAARIENPAMETDEMELTCPYCGRIALRTDGDEVQEHDLDCPWRKLRCAVADLLAKQPAWEVRKT